VAGRVGDASSRVERPRRAPARRSHRRIDDHRHALGQPALHSNHLARASALYGAIGITVVTLGWFFILGRAMVLAITVNAVIYERFGTISQAVFALPVLRALPQSHRGSAASSTSTPIWVTRTTDSRHKLTRAPQRSAGGRVCPKQSFPA
jgi:hypothetical protein